MDLTSPQKLLLDFDILKLSKKANINKQPPMDKYPYRSGNLETPPKKIKHRIMMGQTPDGKGTMADKRGRKSSEDSVHPKNNELGTPEDLDFENIGDPLEIDITNKSVGYDANYVKTRKYKPLRLQGPTETPGAQRYTSFGNRYPGVKSF